jgi:hypothetical protein
MTNINLDNDKQLVKNLALAYEFGASDLTLGKIIAPNKPEEKQLLLGQEFVKMLKAKAVKRNIDLPKRG